MAKTPVLQLKSGSGSESDASSKMASVTIGYGKTKHNQKGKHGHHNSDQSREAHQKEHPQRDEEADHDGKQLRDTYLIMPAQDEKQRLYKQRQQPESSGEKRRTSIPTHSHHKHLAPPSPRRHTFSNLNNRVTPSPPSSHVTLDATMESDSGAPKSLELIVSCTDLLSAGISSMDTMCVVFVRQFGQWKEYKRTEAVKNSSKPQYTESIMLNYEVETEMLLMFSVYQIDNSSPELRHHEHLGSAEVNLVDLYREEQAMFTSTRTLMAPGYSTGRGLVQITSETVREIRSRGYFHIGASKLHFKGFLNLNKPDLMLEVSRSINSVDFHTVYKSEVALKTKDPRWRPFELSVQKMCNGDSSRPIQFSVWNVQNVKQRHLLGQVTTCIKNLHCHTGRNFLMLNLTKPDKDNKKDKKHRGHLKFLLSKIDMKYTLMDYISGGCKLNLMLGLDFTSSNGQPFEETSLHHLASLQDNPYQEVIRSVASLFSHCSTNNKIQAFGFGAKINGKRNDCFPLNGRPSDPYLTGVAGVLSAYRAVVPRLTLSGPTRLAPVIRRAIDEAKKSQLSQENQHYQVLLIVTDGVVNDLDETMAALSLSSDLPLSIIVLGVGPIDFSLMDQLLNGNSIATKPLTRFKYPGGKLQKKRENVMFSAQRRNTTKNGSSGNRAAREALARMSTQLVNYMKQQGIPPNRPVLKMADPMLNNSWSDKSPHLSTKMEHHKSLDDLLPRLPKYSNDTGPSCPTCGAVMESTDHDVIDICLT